VNLVADYRAATPTAAFVAPAAGSGFMPAGGSRNPGNRLRPPARWRLRIEQQQTHLLSANGYTNAILSYCLPNVTPTAGHDLRLLLALLPSAFAERGFCWCDTVGAAGAIGHQELRQHGGAALGRNGHAESRHHRSCCQSFALSSPLPRSAFILIIPST